MNKGYYTLKKSASDSLIEKRSEFIGYACPVTTEDEAIEFVNSIKAKHADARHNVYAYRLREGNITRFSDGGEPHGTAGVPVLDVLRKEELIDAAVVVTRYFGGILLGAGGLVRAYSAAAKLGVDAAGKIFLKPFTVFEMRLNYSVYQKLLKIMADFRVKTVDSDFGEEVYIKGAIPEERFDSFSETLRESTNATVAAMPCGTAYDFEA